jgi:RHS repeat-associated protein
VEDTHIYGCPLLRNDLSSLRIPNSALRIRKDAQGSVRLQTNGSGALVNTITYDAFGKVLSETAPATVDRYAYTGRERDSYTGLQYNRARWYDPATGRWNSEDPLDFAAGDANLYRYVGNFVTGATDPSGLAKSVQDLRNELNYTDDQIEQAFAWYLIYEEMNDADALSQIRAQITSLLAIRKLTFEELDFALGREKSAKLDQVNREYKSIIAQLQAERARLEGKKSPAMDQRAGEIQDQIESLIREYDKLHRSDETDHYGNPVELTPQEIDRNYDNLLNTIRDEAKLNLKSVHEARIRYERELRENELREREMRNDAKNLQRNVDKRNEELEDIGLDLLGTIDPTGIVDVGHAAMYFAKGQITDGLLTMLGVIPILGDAAKLGRAGKAKSSKGIASIGGLDSGGLFNGKPEELIAMLREAGSSRLSKAQLSKIADRLELLADEIKILDDAVFEAKVIGFGHPASTTALYKDGTIYLRKSRGQYLLEDLAHEGTHSLDFSPKGIFKGIDPRTMMPEEVFLREFRAYMAEKLVTGKIPFGSKEKLIEHIVKNYKANRP